jgi:predicted XRE-type DNA-binding protein
MGHIGCVNPRHLRWKSPKANQADRIVHGTYIEGERHHAAKLTEALAEEIIHLVASGSSQRELSKVFGISNQSINDLVKGKTWACVHNRLAGTGAAQVGATSGQS